MLILISVNILVMELDLTEKEFFHFQVLDLFKNVIIVGVDMSFFLHIDNNGKDILILGKGATQELGEH